MDRQIIFTDSNNRKLFRIPDDTCIDVISFDGQRTTFPCKYVNEIETKIGGCIYEAKDFARDQEEIGAVFAPCDEHPKEIGTYEVYQIHDIRSTDYVFRSFKEARHNLNPLDYRRVYASMLAPGVTLEELYSWHNHDDRPFGNKMRSMSISDIVILSRDGHSTAHYVDTFGFAVAPQFLEPKTIPTKMKEVVSGYTITVCIPVNNKVFVLAENPKAVSPFVTWQGYKAGKGYDWGHYYGRRDDAVLGLYKRVSDERDKSASLFNRPRDRDYQR